MQNWIVRGSEHGKNTINPIRERISSIIIPQSCPKKPLSLALGDPSAYSDFQVSPIQTRIIQQELRSMNGNGYSLPIGGLQPRQVLAKHFSYQNIQLTLDDVYLDIGGSGAIHTVMSVFLDFQDQILVPSPGFPLYFTIAGNFGAIAKTYRLKPECNWQVDFADLQEKVSQKTKLLVIVDPSNPCGSVYSKQHLLEILDWAKRHKICILSDEVYHGMTWGVPHYPLGSLSEQVPIFAIGSLSKMFLAPGYRVGWVLIYDKLNLCEAIRPSFSSIKNMLMHPPHFIANAIPRLFEEIPQEFFEEVCGKLKSRAEFVSGKVENIPCLSVSCPQGALYLIVSIDFERLDIESSQEFAEKLAVEEGVVVLPLEAFASEKGFRIVLCNPQNVLEECFDRIAEFINSHLV